MRQIKFRAWDTHTKKFTENDYLMSSCEGKAIDVVGVCSEGGASCNEDVILMQYTGLKDRNGKEIYEGDVVKGHDKTTGDVYFDKGCFMWRGDNKPLSNKDDEDESDVNEWAEVIGNIYQSPSLTA